MIQVKTCYVLTCDRDCEGGGWGERGPYHYEDEAEAIEHARRCGFVIVGNKALCEECAAKADCAATGHQWEDWTPGQIEGVTYLRRDCEHCDQGEYDPPWRELVTLVGAARIVNGSDN